MRPLIVSEFVSLDGIMDAPEQWVFDYHDEATLRFKTEEITEVDALLLGRRTYDIFASSWPSMTGPLADRMNGIVKHVVTRTPTDLDWNNSTPLSESDIPGAVDTLKRQPGGPILVAGSAQLVEVLTQHKLIDEYRLFVCPIVLGEGQRLFGSPSPAALILTAARRFRTGAVLIHYTTHESRHTARDASQLTIRSSA